jgi:Xaa-Pro aminopeptidase
VSQLEALAAIGDRHGLVSLLIREPATIAWLLGCRYHVPNTLDAACFDVIVSGLRDGSPTLSVVSNAIEAPRLSETEFTADGPPIAEHHVVPWWGDRSQHFPTGPDVGADRPWPDSTNVAADLAAARRILDARQSEDLSRLSTVAGMAVGRVARRLTPGLSEYEVAGRMSAELLAAELEPVVLMVAADGRDRRHRHPLPTARRGESSFLLVCCARRRGLITSVTRVVLFSAAGHDHGGRTERYADLLRVEQAYLDASRPGARLGDVARTGIAAYAQQGFDTDEWTRHHQGGFSGWMPREFPAHPGSDDILVEGHVLAWNPSGDGLKVEDTTLVTTDGVRPLVTDPEWPAVEIGGRRRPGLLWL